MPDEAVPPGFTLKIGQDGQRYYIEEGASEEKIQQAMQSVSTGEDVAKSIPASLVRGVAGAAGVPGDVDWGIDAATGWAMRKLGVPEEKIPKDTHAFTNALLPGMGLLRQLAPEQQQQQSAAPTTPEIVKGIEENVTGPLYESQTPIGKGVGKIAEFAPNLLLGPLGAARAGIKAAIPALTRKAVTHVVAPAIGNEIAGQATEGTKYEPYARIAGTLLGGITPSAVERAVRPAPITPSRQRLVDTMTREKVPLSAGDITGSRRVKQFETELGGEAYQKLKARQGEAETAAALRKIGEYNATRATTDVMKRNVQRMGAEFNRLETATPVPLDQKLQSDLVDAVIKHQAVAGTPAAGAEYMMNHIADLAGKNGGILQGEAFKNIRSKMSEWIDAGDAPTKKVLRDMQEALDDAVERNLSPELRKDWQTVRRQYRNYIVLEDAASGPGGDIAEGIINPARLRSPSVAQNQRQYVTGTGDFSDLAHAGEGLLREPPQSGTPGRLMVRAIPAGVAATGAHLLSGDYGLGALAGTTAAATAPAIAGRIGMTRPVQNWLAGQKPGQTTAEARRQALIAALIAPRLFPPPPDQ